MKYHYSAKSVRTAYLCLAPALAGLLFFTILPVIGVVAVSFTKWTGLTPPTFVGLSNYKELFADSVFFRRSVVATLYFGFGAVASGIVYSFSIALLLNKPVKARGFWRTIFFLPYIIPMIATNVIWLWMYEANFGVFNFVLDTVGFGKVAWLQNEVLVVPSLIVMTIWQAGNFIVIFLAGLQNIPKTYLEAVEIDGGNSWHKFTKVTLPLMSPIILFNFLMSMIIHLQVFVPAFALTQGGPNSRTLFMAYLIYREGFMRNSMGYASALSLVFFVFVTLLTIIILRTSRRWLFYEGE